METKDRNKKNKLGLWIGITVDFGVLSCGVGLFWLIYWRKRVSGKTEDLAYDIYMDYEFEKELGQGGSRTMN